MFYCRSIIAKPSDIADIRRNTLSADFKGAVVTSLDQVLYSNMLTHKNHTLNICKEEIFRFQYCIYFRKNSYLPRLFDDVIHSYIPNGLLSYYINLVVDLKYKKKKDQPMVPKKIQLRKLMGGFNILAAGLLLASLTFFLEILSKKVQFLQRIFKIL